MKKAFLCLLVALWSVVSPIVVQGKKRLTIHLTSYNIQHGKGFDGKIDYARQADVLLKAKADVVAIQEVDSVTRRSGGLYSLEEIGKHAGMYSTFAPAIDFQGGKYGIGILSKTQPISSHRIPLPGREESRMLLVAEFKHYVVACTHLSLTETDRLSSIPLIVEEAARWQKPFILMGDLNDEPGSPFYRKLQECFVFLNSPKENTYPAEEAKVCIDHIAVFSPSKNASKSPIIFCQGTNVGKEPFSDHLPLHAKLSIRK